MKSSEPLIEYKNEEINYIKQHFPVLSLIEKEVIKGIKSIDQNWQSANITFETKKDPENPKWDEIVITILPLHEVTFNEAIEIWKKLEDSLRPKFEKIFREWASKLIDSPVEISNRNISICVDW